MSSVPQWEDFYQRLEENRSINNLIFLDSSPLSIYFGHLQYLREFLRRMPNVKSLTLAKYSDKGTFLVIAQSLNKLETVATYTFNGYTFNDIKLPFLKALHIQHLTGDVNWNAFTKANAKLTELTIVLSLNSTLLNNNHMYTITKNIRPQSLSLGHDFAVDKCFLEIIKENCPDLKRFYLHCSVYFIPRWTGS